jgi:tungstate transport system substrate-binding protein
LLDAIIPLFEEQYNADVAIVVAGTGQAIALCEAGDADVLLVRDPG